MADASPSNPYAFGRNLALRSREDCVNPFDPMSSLSVTAAPITVSPATEAARYLVGQDFEGHWIAVEVHGRGGGLFRDRQAAFHFAENETGRRRDAVIVTGERIALRL